MSTPDTEKAVEALLSCPFCGEAAEMDTQRGYRSLGGKLGSAVAIYCVSCSADMTWCRADTPELQTEDIIAVLTEQWNKRAALEASGYPARIAELEREVERLRTIVDEQQDEIDDQDSDLDEIIDERKSLYAQLTAAEQRVEKLTEALDYIARLSLCDWSANTARAALSNSESLSAVGDKESKT